MRTRHAAILAVAALLLGACSSGSSTIGPTNTLSGNGQGPTPPPAAFHPMFSLGEGILPYPTDLYFNGSTDGTLRLPTGLATLPNAAAINGLDGFSTTAPITVRFSAPIDATSLSVASVVVVKVSLDNATKGWEPPPAGQIPQPLAYGTDFIAYVAGAGPAGAFAKALDSAGQTLVIQPTHPLTPSSGASNIGYMVFLTDGIKDTHGNSAVPDNDFATVRNGALADLGAGLSSPTCSGITNATFNGVCRLTFGQLAVGATLQVVNPTHVVLSFSFSTQSTSDTLNILWATYQATPVAPGTIVAAPIVLGGAQATTRTFIGPASPGYADIWAGRVTVPYYLTAATGIHDTAPLTTFWTAAAAPPPGLDPASRKLTRFNPIPHKTADLAIPMLVGVPNANAGCSEPAGGWPVIVFQHGITGNRSQALAIFDGYASQCFVTVAIDLPLHGIVPTDSAALLRDVGHERTFDLDLMNNATGAAGPDGITDSSGSHTINLASLLTSRDNLRQAESDLLWLAHVLPTLSFKLSGTPDVNGNFIQLAGQSLGSIVSMPVLSVVSLATGAPNSPYRSGLLSVPGGGIAYLLRDSPAFSPVINGGLAAASHGAVVPGATLYDNFLRDAQTAVDSGDPLNYAAAAVAGRPILIQQVVGGGLLPDGTHNLPDLVIPNSATQRLLSAANFVRFSGSGVPAPGTGAYINFLYGSHGSLLTPDQHNPPAPADGTNAATFFEMQREAVVFGASGGGFVDIAAYPFVVQP